MFINRQSMLKRYHTRKTNKLCPGINITFKCRDKRNKKNLNISVKILLIYSNCQKECKIFYYVRIMIL